MDAVAPLGKPQLAVPGRLLKLRSDAALAERFAAGDEAAFTVLYERHRPSVIAVCMGVLGSTHDAEDAAQDTFTALAGALRSAPPRELRPWLTRVARNAAVDVTRRRRRTVPTDAELMPDTAVGPSNGKAELESVMAGIRELPENQRTALLMRELAGHSYVEIAALLEVDEEAVRGLIARARVSLRAHREASEMSCVTARRALAEDPNGGSRDKAVRHHIRGCAPCRAYGRALRDDARALRGLAALPATGVAGSGAIVGGLAAKGALLGGALTQVTAACAVSACAVGGVVLLAPHPHAAAPVRARHTRAHRVGASVRLRSAPSDAGSPGAVLLGTGRRPLFSGRAVSADTGAKGVTARRADTRARTSHTSTPGARRSTHESNGTAGLGIGTLLGIAGGPPAGSTPAPASGAGTPAARPSVPGTSPSAATAAGWHPGTYGNSGSPGTGYGGTRDSGGASSLGPGAGRPSGPSSAGSGSSSGSSGSPGSSGSLGSSGSSGSPGSSGSSGSPGSSASSTTGGYAPGTYAGAREQPSDPTTTTAGSTGTSTTPTASSGAGTSAATGSATTSGATPGTPSARGGLFGLFAALSGH